jgi:glycine cleavage system regulatory protein
MTKSLVMTIIGPDRPGLVEALSDIITNHGGSWLESRMAQLAGHFTGVLRIECPENQAAALLTALRGGAVTGLEVNVFEEAPTDPSVSRILTFDVVGNDRPGIIKQLSTAIVQCGGNVEELESNLESAPMSGHSVFHATGTVRVESAFQDSDLIKGLENLGDDLSVSVNERD